MIMIIMLVEVIILITMISHRRGQAQERPLGRQAAGVLRLLLIIIMILVTTTTTTATTATTITTTITITITIE